MYQNWQINKSDLHTCETEYMTVANWCDAQGQYYIDETETTYFVAKIPEPSVEDKNNRIRELRETLFKQYADPMKYDYDENLARFGTDDERTLKSRTEWLNKKDEIRHNNPYIE